MKVGIRSMIAEVLRKVDIVGTEFDTCDCGYCSFGMNLFCISNSFILHMNNCININTYLKYHII